MCGRYNIEFGHEDEIDEIITKVEHKVREEQKGYVMKRADVFPTDLAPILIREEKKIAPKLSYWGFQNFNRKQVIINARAETASQKKMFRDSLLYRRCIVPSTGFYEWDQTKKKYYITRPKTKALYMAGLYNLYEDGNHFVILTTMANNTMQKIHDRMPVILEKDQFQSWIFDEVSYHEILKDQMPEIKLERVEAPFEQLTLF